MQQYLTAKEAAEELGLTPARIRQMCAEGTIKAARTCGHRGGWRIYREKFVKQYAPPEDPEMSREKPELQPSLKSAVAEVKRFLKTGK